MLSKEQSTAAKVASFHKEDERKDKAIILTKFLVKPSEIVSASAHPTMHSCLVSP